MLARKLFLSVAVGLALSAQMAGATPPPRPSSAEMERINAAQMKRLARNTVVVERPPPSDPEAFRDVRPWAYYLLPDGTARTRSGRLVRWQVTDDRLCVDGMGCWTVSDDDPISLDANPDGLHAWIREGNPLNL